MSPRVHPTPPPKSAEQRRQELAETSAKLDEAERLRPVVANLREDILRMEQKRDRLAALGDGHIEIARESYDQQYGISVAWEPLRSVLGGFELAEQVAVSIAPLRQELASTESRIEELLA
jgi:hypothetical protein